MKKIASLSSLFTILFIVPLFAQTKKEKIEKFFVSQMGDYSSKKFIEVLDKHIDEYVPQLKNRKFNHEPGSMELSSAILKMIEPQLFEDTALNNQKQKKKQIVKDIYGDIVEQINTLEVHLYDSAFTEEQIDKLITYNNSKEVKKYLAVSLENSHNNASASLEAIDTNYSFGVGRKEKIDSFIEAITPANSNVEISKMIAAVRKDNLKGTGMESQSPQIERMVNEQFEAMKDKQKKKREIIYDKNFSNQELDTLIAYSINPEMKRINQIGIQLNTIVVQRVLIPKGVLFRAKVKSIK